jgi:uncharacterized membrane protein YjgN (DUF898 family)
MIEPSVSAASAVALPTPVEDDTVQEPQPLSLVFTGSASEYFRIWIVNVCLTLLTLGIYSAWAKVRKKRYFYSHTLLDGTPFQYLAQPLPILKGRIIAFVLFAAWYVATTYVFSLIPIVLVVFLILAPWVAVRSAAFNARYSAYRNMTFEFTGSYKTAAKVIYLWGLAIFTVVGYAWWQQRIRRFMVTHLGIGGVKGEFSALGVEYFIVYLIAGAMFFGAAMAFGAFVAIGAATAGDASPATIMWVVIPAATVFYLLWGAIFAYAHSRITNLAWNSTRLGPVRFRSTIGAWRIFWIFLSNVFVILASVGLLIPWASIRLAKYRVAQFGVSVDGDLQAFQGSDSTTVQAAGAELGEFFDFDMAL